ncbi:basic proline-rich protein-like [Pan paniscus]|uniref:basic proline-rich protein-like n=1 Tax=Pan paniscus TaxID=9597 RepID=UPI003007CC93
MSTTRQTPTRVGSNWRPPGLDHTDVHSLRGPPKPGLPGSGPPGPQHRPSLRPEGARSGARLRSGEALRRPARPPARKGGETCRSRPLQLGLPTYRCSVGKGKSQESGPRPVCHPPLTEQRAAPTKPSPPPLPPLPPTAASGAARRGPDCVTRSPASEAR